MYTAPSALFFTLLTAYLAPTAPHLTPLQVKGFSEPITSYLFDPLAVKSDL